MKNQFSVVPEIGTRYICNDGEYIVMEIGGKPRWVKNAIDDGKPRLWDKMPQAPEQKLQTPGKILEYL